jgi:cellulose synthase/poly-beta-1,6-N-acetylglucosamine synthase-like glycosyltransferase
MVTFTDGVLFTTYFFLLFLSIFWLLVLFLSEGEEKPKRLKGTPFFTTIVPAYNEEKNIVETLTSLINLKYPNEKMEIIVVNDGSTDATREKVENFIQLHPNKSISLINQENMGKGRAMNNGLAQARGEFFACLDADSFVGDNALEAMLPYFSDNEVAAVCPLLKVRKPAGVLQKVQWVEYIINMFYKFLNAKIDCIHVTPGPFSVYRTKVVQDLGGYDEETITEDLEIAIRLQKHQYKLMQTFDAVVETVAPHSWKSLFFQRVRWYKGSIDNAINYRKLMFDKKYGDFGFLRMPTIIISGVMALILMLTLFREIGKQIVGKLASWNAINFDLFTLLMNIDWSVNLLGLPFMKIFVAATVMGLSFFIMIMAYRVVKERITNHGRTWIGLITYLTIYAIFISTVWVYIAFMFVTGKKRGWG